MSDISAFPQMHIDTNHGGYDRVMMGGMTLRDYFAAAALRHAMHLASDQWERINEESRAQTTARVAYEYADAMLKARGE